MKKLLALLVLFPSFACNGPPVAQYALEEDDCVLEAGTRPEADQCRKDKRAAFCAQYPSACSAPADAGGQ